jgi:hypothetical protein
MKKLIVAFLLMLVLSTSGYSQFGLGASAGMLYPGLSKSDGSESQFDLGWGYDFFIRHNLVQLSDSLMLKARWSYRHYKTTIEIPNVLEIWFKFNYLTLDFFLDLAKSQDFTLYSGLGASLVSTNAEKDFTDVSETLFVPEILVGGEYRLSDNYNLFLESSFQFGSIGDVDGQSIPITGIRIVFGATMFLISEDE